MVGSSHMPNRKAVTARDLDRCGRNNPTTHSLATAEFRVGFFRKLVDWLAARRLDSPTGRLLDFGCGDLLLGRETDGLWVVDGYDEWADARNAARMQILNLREPGVVYDRTSCIPRGSYDAVVLNSLFQYVPDLIEAERLLRGIVPLLTDTASIGIVITDAVSDGSSSLFDLADMACYAIGRSGLVEGLVRTAKGTRSGRPSKRFRHSQADLSLVAKRLGLDMARLPENLSVFTRRATFVLRPSAGMASTAET